MQILAGRGSELEHDFAFGVLRQALERPLAELDDAHRDAVTAGQAAHAIPLLHPARSAPSSESLFHGLYWLLANLAERRPLVLAVDDAHWADESSVQALAYLARRLEQLPVALVVCTRPPDVDGHGALAALVADAAAERLTPDPLGREAVAALSGSGRSGVRPGGGPGDGRQPLPAAPAAAGARRQARRRGGRAGRAA